VCGVPRGAASRSLVSADLGEEGGRGGVTKGKGMTVCLADLYLCYFPARAGRRIDRSI